jgi:hypothetical protein
MIFFWKLKDGKEPYGDYQIFELYGRRSIIENSNMIEWRTHA